MNQNRTIPANAAGQAHHVSLTSATVAFALSRGMDMTEIEVVTGLDSSALGDPNARLSDFIAHRLWVALVERSDRSVALSLEAARGASFSALGGLMHGAQFAATLRDALTFIGRNGKLLADRLELDLIENQYEIRLTAYHPNDSIDQGRVAEVGAALVSRLIREILGVAIPPKRVEFPFGPLGPVSDYQSFFRCPVEFDCRSAALVFSPDAFAAPVKTADPTLFEFVERHFEMVLNQIGAQQQSPEYQQLRSAIADAASRGDYRMAGIVSRAQLSIRTAQRVAARARQDRSDNDYGSQTFSCRGVVE